MIYSFIKSNKPRGICVKRVCEELEVSSSGYFKHLTRQQDIKAELRSEEQVLKAFHYHKGLYGYRKLFHYLRGENGMEVSLSQFPFGY